MRARPIGAFLLAAITGLLVISLSLLQTPFESHHAGFKLKNQETWLRILMSS